MDYDSEMVRKDLLILIPSRAGSKGIPNKNIVDLDGNPLIAWTISPAIHANISEHVVVSTNSETIRKIALNCGASAPFLRPDELSNDVSLQIDVIKHCLDFFRNEGIDFKSTLLLQPTTPFRSKEVIADIFRIWNTTDVDTLISVSDASKYDQSTIYRAETSSGNIVELKGNSISPMGTLRQNFKKVWWRNGSIYLFKNSNLVEYNSIYGKNILGYISTFWEGINLDEESDLEVARILAPVFKKVLLN